jgi:superfamily II DNA or RNA helicase
MQERPYQNAAHAAIKSEFVKGFNRQLVQMATGTGKTVVFSQLPTRMKDVLPGQMLILAHREELIDQSIEAMQVINPTLKIEKEKAEHKADTSIADCVVASVATLGRKGNQRIGKYNWENFDKIVTDEAHHSIADTYLNVYDASGILSEYSKNRLMLGVTATPQRGDGKALAQLYQKISFVYSMRSAIEDGWLVEICGYKVNTQTSLDYVKSSGGDYAVGELAATVNTPQRNQLVVKSWLDRGEGRQTVVFAVDIAHAQALAETFQAAGVAAEAVWGDDPERKDKLARHRARHTKVIVNCGILTEGYDDWQIGCVVLARPTKSAVLFTQMIGRGTRLEKLFNGDTPNRLTWTGGVIKQDCIVIDVVDASSKNSLVTLPTLMGMNAKLDLQGKGLIESIKMLEKAQKDFPHIDFNSLPDLSQLQAHIQNVNLFDIKFPEEVQEHSKLSWYPSATGGYVLVLPEKDVLHVEQNLLDKWEVYGTIKGKKYRGDRESIDEIFAAADGLVQKTIPEALKVLNREAQWHGDPPTEKQIATLKRFFKGKPLPLDLDKGKASRLISSYLAGKA